MAVARAGVRTPRQEGPRHAQRRHARATGKAPRGPAGSQEAGCAPGASEDGTGARRVTRRMARMPATTKATRQWPRTAEGRGALRQRPEVRSGNGAAGAPDNWSALGAPRPCGAAGRDGSPAAEPLGAARGAAAGAGTPTDQARLETVRVGRRAEDPGVAKGMEARWRWRTRCPRRQALQKALASFRAPRHRRRSRARRAHNLPMGAGGVEAAWNTWGRQRWKRAGRRWRTAGGPALLPLRAVWQRERGDRAWPLLGETEKRAVVWPRKVLAFSEHR